MADLTKWPTPQDVQKRLASAGVTVRLNARLQDILDEVAAEIAQRTHRQWIPDAVDNVRFYDGTGTAEIEVDEMVSFTHADVLGILGAPGYTLVNVVLVFEQSKPQTRLMTARGSTPAWTTGGVIIPYPNIFPTGRQNISVTGRFGYGLSIPADLWHRAADEAARQAGQEAIFSPNGGIVVDYGEADVRERFAEGGAAAIWPVSAFDAAVRRYTRPLGRRLRDLRPSMI